MSASECIILCNDTEVCCYDFNSKPILPSMLSQAARDIATQLVDKIPLGIPAAVLPMPSSTSLAVPASPIFIVMCGAPAASALSMPAGIGSPASASSTSAGMSSLAAAPASPASVGMNVPATPALLTSARMGAPAASASSASAGMSGLVAALASPASVGISVPAASASSASIGIGAPASTVTTRRQSSAISSVAKSVASSQRSGAAFAHTLFQSVLPSQRAESAAPAQTFVVQSPLSPPKAVSVIDQNAAGQQNRYNSSKLG